MRLAFAIASLVVAIGAHAADPIYLDAMVETPLADLKQHFPKLEREGCYQIGERYLQISIDKKDRKPWRVTVAAEPPCRRPDPGPALDIRSRAGVSLGDTTIGIIERLGRPDTASPPNADQRRLGAIEYFYICRVSEGCARHTSVFVRDGKVTAISEWYSE